jgi:hypothetical protein
MKSRHSTGRPAAGGRKKTYRRPETLSREQLEALAVDCGGTGKTDALSCSIGPIQS